MAKKRDIENLRQEILARIERSAQCGKSEDVIRHSGFLKETEALIARLAEVERAFEALDRMIRSPPGEANGAARAGLARAPQLALQKGERDMAYAADADRAESRAKARAQRERLEQEVSRYGINLTRVRGTVYRIEGDGLLGMGFATERKPNRWFLGLPAEDYHALVLICEGSDGESLRFLLPREFYEEHRSSLTASNGQLKFNIVREAVNYELLVPGHGRTSITRFQDNFDALQP